MNPKEHDPNNPSNDAARGDESLSRARGHSNGQERWLSTVLQNASDMITVLEADRTIRYVSPAAERILGYRPEELMGTNAFDYVHPDDIGFVSDSFAEVLEMPGLLPPIEFRLRTSDGCWRHMEVIRNNQLDDPVVRGVVTTSRDLTERKGAEERVHFQAKLLDTVGQAVIATDPQGNIIYWNRASEELYGWSEEEAMGRSIMEVTPSEELVERAEEIMAEILAGRSWSGEFELRRKDGTTFPAMVTGTPVHDEEGTLVGIIEVSIDITELKKTEKLRRSEGHLRSLVQNASDVITVLEADGTVRYVSPAIERMVGYSPQESTGRNGFELLHPDDLPRGKVAFSEALRNPGVTLTIEVRMRHRDGSWRHVEVRGTNLLEDPSVKGIVLNWRDITERREAVEALRENEQKFRLLAENAGDLIFRYRIKPTPGFEYVSPSATEMIGYTPEEHYADPQLGRKIVHPDDRHLIEEVLRNPESLVTIRWLHKDGSVIWTEQRSKPFYDETGELVAIEGISRNITGRKGAEEALRGTQEFLTGILDNAPLPIYSVSKDGRMRSANRFFADFVGMPQEKLLGASGHECELQQREVGKQKT